MANLKNIVDLPVAESAEGLNLIVNDNGAAKQIAAHEVGAQADFAVTDENSPAFIKNKPEVVQADWSQNNSAAPDYVKNRTHWVEEEVILERQTIDGFADMNGGYGFLLSYTINIPDGDMTVYWDGIKYDCVASNGIVGNTLPFSGDDNGIPFLILQEAIDSVSGIAVMDGSTATSHEVGIVKKNYHKLDAKYLPDEWDLIIENITGRNETDISIEDIKPIPQEKIDKLMQKMTRGEPVKIVYRKMPIKGNYHYSYIESQMQVVEGYFDNNSITGGYAYAIIPNFAEGWIEPSLFSWICIGFGSGGISIDGNYMEN